MTERQQLGALVREFPRRGVVVVGDLVADQFVYGEIGRVSREAPVLILRHERTETVPGGAANCAANLATLGARVSLIGLIGDDEAGRALVASLRSAGVDCEGVVCDKHLRTTTKVRILAGHAHGLRQQVIRLDYEGSPPADESLTHELAARLLDAADGADAFVVSDYNYGVASGETVAALRDAARERQAPVLVDSRFRLTEFAGFTSATPNEDEVEHVLGLRLDDNDAPALERAARELLDRLAHDALLITRGSNGMLLLERGGDPVHLPVVGSREAVDVTGAGDTVIAAYALALACGASFADAARVANHAGGLAVMKRGTACVTAAELLASLAGGGADGP